MRVSAETEALTVEGLRVDAVSAGVDIVSEVSFTVPPGMALGIVGESGSGKTTVAMGLLGFARPGTCLVSGSVQIGGVDLLALEEEELRARRGALISFVPQNPSKALSPGMRIGRQLAEMQEVHRPDVASIPEFLRAAWEGAQLPFGDGFSRRYPHQLSGGQQQRLTIAMALLCEPQVIVMDEPTTGLDVITQARLLDVIRDLRARRDTIIVYVSHDLGVVRNLVDRVAVMYGGRLVEEAAVDELFREPRHPYTRRLLEAIPRVHRHTVGLRGIPGSAVEPWRRPQGCPFAPRCEFRVERCEAEMPPAEPAGGARRVVRCWRWSELRAADYAAGRATRSLAAVTARIRRQASGGEGVLLSVRDLHAGYAERRRYPWRQRSWSPAVAGVSFDVPMGACVAIVGESGSGKTTLGRCLAGLHSPRSGEIRFDGLALAALARRREVSVRRRIQIIFQDPDSSLNPSMTVGTIIRRPLRQFFNLNPREARSRVAELLEQLHLPSTMASRLPRELSGGEKQRVALARALAARPDLLICDEVTSALDVAVQANIIELLEELRSSTGMAMIFISHDLAVVRTISDEVIVMRDGELREQAARDSLFANPRDTYTRELLAAIPDLREDDYPPPEGGAELIEAVSPS